MAADGGLIALTFLLLAALCLLLYCLLKQVGASKQCLRRICAFLFTAPLLRGSMASGGLSGLGGHDDEEDGERTGGVRATSKSGFFWRTSDEERSILGHRRAPNQNLTGAIHSGAQSTGSNKPPFETTNSYHGDYFYSEQEQMATVTANNSKPQGPVTNGVTASHKASFGTTPLGQSPQKPKAKANVTSNAPDYTYTIPPPPKKETAASSTVAAASPYRSSHASPAGEDGRKKTAEGPPPNGQDIGSSMLNSISASSCQQQQISGACRPATPDFRFTVLADDDDESQRKTLTHGPHVNGAAKMGGAHLASATNGTSFRSVSVDAGDRGQLSADMSVDNERRHSLQSTTSGVVPLSTSENPSPSGSISDLDPESMLVLDDGPGSRRTSISSVDSSMERLDDSHAGRLTRALSSDSLDSTCSIMELAGSDKEIGQLETRLYYDSSSQYLHIWILQAYDIKPIVASNNGGLVEYWVVVFLLPHQRPLYRTQLQPFAPVLQFHEQFRQRVRDQDLRKLALLCQMYCRIRPPNETQTVSAALAAAGATPPILPSSSSSSSLTTPTKRSSASAGNELIGQAKVRLKDVELMVANTLWLSLLPKIDNNGTDRQLGELLFSLSYLPTAERLTVVVAKARNIKTFDEIVPEKIMVRVYLVYGAKISKKKTSVKSAVEGSAVFNESMIFSLSQSLVQKIYLRLSVVEPSVMKNSGDQRTIGHVTVGSRRSGKEFGHWQKMTEQPRKPVSMWHYLSPKSKKLT